MLIPLDFSNDSLKCASYDEEKNTANKINVDKKIKAISTLSVNEEEMTTDIN